MRQTTTPPPPAMSNPEQEIWQKFIRDRCGMDFAGGQLPFLRQQLWKRMQVHHIRSYKNYYHYVASEVTGTAEWPVLLELLLNNESSFFRHPAALKALTEHLLPELRLLKTEQGADVIAMWSVGCSTGQEPYSMAMVSLDWLAQLNGTAGAYQPNGWQIEISGSDISEQALAKARQGRYKSHELRYLPDYYRQRYMRQAGDSFYEVNEAARALVRFDYFNLTDPATFTVSGQDVIFCHNVLIYFQPEDRLKIVNALVERLNPGGYLALTPTSVKRLALAGVYRLDLPEALVYRRG